MAKVTPNKMGKWNVEPANRPVKRLKPRVIDPLAILNDVQVPSLRRVHIAWLFTRAGFRWIHIQDFMEGLGFDARVIKRLSLKSGMWMQAPSRTEQIEFERRARKALVIERSCNIEQHEPMPPEEILLMGDWTGAIQKQAANEIVHSDGTVTQEGHVLGMQMPDVRRTIKEAVDAGLGTIENIQRIKAMISAEHVAVPTGKGGFDLLPISDSTKRVKKGETYTIQGYDEKGNPMPREMVAYDDGVIVLGTFYDSSFIVQDRSTQMKGMDMARRFLGVTDMQQLEQMLLSLKVKSLDLEIEDKSLRREMAIAQDMEAELGIGKEVRQGGIKMVRPKALTAEEFNKKNGRT